MERPKVKRWDEEPVPKTVEEAIAWAEAVLPGVVAPEGELDPRWQAIIAVGEFIPGEPEAVWQFARRWGSHEGQDLRMAVATCLVEHLLDSQFDQFFPRVVAAAREDPLFASTFTYCWKFGQAKESDRARSFDRVQAAIRKRERKGRGPSAH
jgi:hypothetical protein